MRKRLNPNQRRIRTKLGTVTIKPYRSGIIIEAVSKDRRVKPQVLSLSHRAGMLSTLSLFTLYKMHDVATLIDNPTEDFEKKIVQFYLGVDEELDAEDETCRKFDITPETLQLVLEIDLYDSMTENQ